MTRGAPSGQAIFERVEEVVVTIPAVDAPGSTDVTLVEKRLSTRERDEPEARRVSGARSSC